MSFQVRFDDEPGFERTALRLVGWSAAAAFAAVVASELAGDPRRLWPLGAALVPPAAVALRKLWLLRGLRRWLAPLATGAAAVAGCLTAAALTEPLMRLGLFGWIWAPCAGAIVGAVAGPGLAAAHLVIRRDAVLAAWRRAQGELAGEARALAERALEIWSKVDAVFDRRSPVRRATQDAALRLLELARRWQTADGGGLPSTALLQEQIAEVHGKLQGAHDDVIREQYRGTEVVLHEQLRAVTAIVQSRERVIARMHHHLAAMDRLRLAGINLRSADASRQAATVQPIVDELSRLGEDIDCSSQGMREAESP